MADIFEEVDEELKQENFKKLWDRFGRYIVAAVVLIVAGVSAHQAWQHYTQTQQQAYSERFLAAMKLSEEGKDTDAAAVLTVLAAEASDGYAMLARFREAAARRAAGDEATAIEIYDALAVDDANEPFYRELAVLLSVMAQADTGDIAAMSERLTPLAESGPWRHTANEYLGLFAIRQGDTAAARKRFQSVADDLEAPQGARARAAELLLTLDK
ncbi:MAG: tetratricopeptide repeat protein [Alphaproteobacteria bacterium]|nr:tetratricopeptide repeat protein [Alphaproteobacteria bacterium]